MVTAVPSVEFIDSEESGNDAAAAEDSPSPSSLPTKRRRQYVTEVDDAEAYERSIELSHNDPLPRFWDERLPDDLAEEFRQLIYDVALTPRTVATRLHQRSMISGGPEHRSLLTWANAYRDWLYKYQLLPPPAYGGRSTRGRPTEDKIIERLEVASHNRRALMQKAASEQRVEEVNGQPVVVAAPNYNAYARLDATEMNYNMQMLGSIRGAQQGNTLAMNNIVVSVQVDPSRATMQPSLKGA